jgi:NADPH:quinone reductase-like Zn-dependent oxidoreductase
MLRVETWPEPVAGAGEAIVALRAAALNHRDVWIRQGTTSAGTAPIVPGSDGAGYVVAIGPGVDPSWNGAPVVINPSLDWGLNPRVQGAHWRILGLPDDGTYAEFVKVPAANLHRKPEALTFEQAAAVPLAGLTAYRALVTRARLQPDDVVLVTGIGGGVALFALAIARSIGAIVFVTSGSDDKIARARELGASGGVSYHAPDWPRRLADMTDGQGPSVIVDGTGGESLAKAIEIVRPGGRVVNYGGTGGPIAPLSPRSIFWKQIDVMGSTMGTSEEFCGMLRLYDEGGLRPVVDSVLPVEEAAAAHARMERGDQFGKIVFTI